MPAKSKHTFAIIDGHALLHRAWHALPALSTKDGIMVNAAYGFTSMLLRIIKDLKPDYIAVTFDPPGETFRHEAYEDYKAQRESQPDELYEQIPIVKEVVAAFGFDIYERKGFEADDVIGTIAKRLQRYYGLETVIVTGDMDTLQLVNAKTKVYAFKRSITDVMIYDEAAVVERYGIKPEQLIDYKALRGDPSDNIPGVPGIGEKTALELIANFGTLEKLYKSIDKVEMRGAERIRKLLREHEEDAQLSRELVTIDTEVPMKFYYKSCLIEEYDRDEVLSVFGRYEFRSLMKRAEAILPQPQQGLFAQGEKKAQPPKGSKYHLINTKKGFDEFLKKLIKKKTFAFDTETTGLNPFLDEIVGASFSWKSNEAYYVQLNCDHREYFLEKLRPIFEDENYRKIGQNVKYDWEIMSTAGIEVRGIYADTMIASYLLNPGTRGHNLDNLAFVEFGHEMIPIEDLIGKGKDQVTMDEVDIEKVSPYACEDADFTWRLWELFKKRLEESKVKDLFFDVEMPLVVVLGYMEREGVAIDLEFFKKMSREVHRKAQKAQHEICKMAGFSFNVSSPAQLKKVLFEVLKLSTDNIKKGKTGFSTAERELEKLKDQHPIIERVLEFRELTKLENTYLDAIPELLNPKTKRIHTHFNQTITATGRLSSSGPNLQNIPIRTELGRRVREGFVAQPGFRLLSADYSQIELRVIASLSGDKKMVETFKKGEDIHRATAAEINGVKPEKVTPEMRYAAKEVNFGVLYGMGSFGLSERAGISYDQAKEFIEKYFVSYKGVKKYLDGVIEKTKEEGFAQTMFGRIRNIPEIHSGVYQVRAAAERMAINMPVQGTAADLMKMAMANVHERLKSDFPKDYPKNIKMMLQVHDELVFEVKENLVEKTAKIVKQEMEKVAKLGVPIVADLKAGPNWGQMEDLSV